MKLTLFVVVAVAAVHENFAEVELFAFALNFHSLIC